MSVGQTDAAISTAGDPRQQTADLLAQGPVPWPKRSQRGRRVDIPSRGIEGGLFAADDVGHAEKSPPGAGADAPGRRQRSGPAEPNVLAVRVGPGKGHAHRSLHRPQ